MRQYLKVLREKNNLTQAEIAEKLNISESYYAMIELGERQKDMNLSLVEKLAEVFGVPVGDIIAEESKLKG